MPHSQYLYLRIGQGLKESVHTYAQFTDILFGSLPKSKTIPRMNSIIGTHENSGFSLFIDNYIGSYIDFNS